MKEVYSVGGCHISLSKIECVGEIQSTSEGDFFFNVQMDSGKFCAPWFRKADYPSDDDNYFESAVRSAQAVFIHAWKASWGDCEPPVEPSDAL